MSELMGGTMSGTGNLSAEEMQQQSYEEAKKLVDQMIESVSYTHLINISCEND